MAGVKPTQGLIRQHHPITQPILARKDDGLRRRRDGVMISP
jgi:hypothetical protein